ncbi:MAG TPA: HAMP domain-containing sensor histidine kinase [Jatrophihabitans sp.]
MQSGAAAGTGVSPARLAGVAIPLVVGLILSVLLIVHERSDARREAASAVRALVASTVTKIRTEVRNELAAAAGGPASKIVSANHLADSQISPDIAITARDSGQATLDDSMKTASIVLPVYRGGSVAPDTAARRAAIESYRIVPLTLTPTLADLQPLGGGLAVKGPHRLVTAAPTPAPSDAITYQVDMDLTGSPGWVVEAWLPERGIPGVAWLWAVGLFALFAAGAAAFWVMQRREAVANAGLRAIERDRALVTGMAPVVQGSLDLGEVVPAFSAQLADGLHLSGLSLSTPGDRGEKQVFGWGVVPDKDVRPATSTPEGLQPGETLAIGLSRGGRTLGVLRVVAGVPLGGDELVALSVATDMLGSTFANAETFVRQQELVERMRSVDELKTVFLATASHELRTPVTAITGFSTLLIERWEDMGRAQQRALVERVKVNGHRLATLIEQLLDFSQLERGLPRANDQILELGETVRGILDEQPEVGTSHQLVTNIVDGCYVRGSTAAVERILTNLVGNAAKYSPAETTITVTVQSIGERVELLVDDQGPGVSVDDRERVFSRFYRGRGDTVTRTRGAGIGLAIVAEYAGSMAGLVSVDESPGGGARFRVSMPKVGTLVNASSAEEADVTHS